MTLLNFRMAMLLPTPAELASLLPHMTARERAELDALLAPVTVPPPPMTFREFVGLANPRYIWFPHCEVLERVLMRVAEGELDRVMIFLPPRHGKSEIVSRLFSAYYGYRFPDRWVALVSYGAELAFTLAGKALENYNHAMMMRGTDMLHGGAHGFRFRGEGGLWASGAGGSQTGRGFHLGLIDDPHKSAAEVHSDLVRMKVHEWYQGTFYNRQEPNAAIILIQTRWHQNDLAGWLLEQETNDDEMPERWHIVNLPAVAEPPETFQWPATCTVEPDWRETGEPLCPPRYPLEKLARLEAKSGPYYWSALYQQHPRPPEGSRFRYDWFKWTEAIPAGHVLRVRYWDLAGTEGDGDYSVGVRVSMSADRRITIEDVVRGQWGPLQRSQKMKATADRDRAECGAVVQWFEQEAGVGGADRTMDIIRVLQGHVVYTEPATRNKDLRAQPLASQAEGGNVWVVKDKPWVGSFMDELCDFPYGKHDDQVDAVSAAFNKLVTMSEQQFRVGRMVS